MVANTVINGINPNEIKLQATHLGEFLTPVELPADHYFRKLNYRREISYGSRQRDRRISLAIFSLEPGGAVEQDATRRRRRAAAPPRRAGIVAIELLLRCFNVAFIIVGDL
jgi:hypothetical protein